jgi:hypothetical protein
MHGRLTNAHIFLRLFQMKKRLGTLRRHAKIALAYIHSKIVYASVEWNKIVLNRAQLRNLRKVNEPSGSEKAGIFFTAEKLSRFQEKILHPRVSSPTLNAILSQDEVQVYKVCP